MSSGGRDGSPECHAEELELFPAGDGDKAGFNAGRGHHQTKICEGKRIVPGNKDWERKRQENVSSGLTAGKASL